jgi:hypothetical protein
LLLLLLMEEEVSYTVAGKLLLHLLRVFFFVRDRKKQALKQSRALFAQD